MDKKEQIKKNRIVRCPRCGKSARYDETNPSRPFCSDRCKIIDAGAWADEDYRVAGAPAFPDDMPEE